MKTTDIKENAVKTEGGKRAFLLQTALFSSFLFLQFVILRMGNQAGRGFLSDAAQEYVYYAIQVFAVLGFLSFSLSRKRLDGTFAGRLVSGASLAILTAGFF
ncbi:MAG: hypothetical protein ILO68_00615, partial [Clostridia bacterium]|nr:hypothetical protein [Clostridia bacterium]